MENCITCDLWILRNALINNNHSPNDIISSLHINEIDKIFIEKIQDYCLLKLLFLWHNLVIINYEKLQVIIEILKHVYQCISKA